MVETMINKTVRFCANCKVETLYFLTGVLKYGKGFDGGTIAKGIPTVVCTECGQEIER